MVRFYEYAVLRSIVLYIYSATLSVSIYYKTESSVFLQTGNYAYLNGKQIRERLQLDVH